MAKKVSALIGFEGNTRQIEYEVPENEPGVWGADYQFNQVGKVDHPRLDAIAKVTGKAKYSYDINRPNMLHAALVTCPYAHARILKVDISQAQGMPGVKAIELFDNIENSVARHAGWMIAAVAAETPAQAEDAARAVKVEYKELPFVIDPGEAVMDEAPRVHKGGNVEEKPKSRERGDIEKGFQEAEVISEGTYNTQVQVHNCLEPHGCVAEWNNDELTVWHSTQGIWTVSRGMAKALGIPDNKSRCITEYMGGGFGSKFGPEDFCIVAAKMARKAQRPVKMMLAREQEMILAGNKPAAKLYVKVGAKKDGTITAIYAQVHNVPGHSGNSSSAVPFFEHYNIPNVKIDEFNVLINAGSSRAFRAPGRPQGCFGLEMALEEMAMKLGMDPYEFRAKNITGGLLKALPKEFEMGRDKFGWNQKYKSHGASGEGSVKRGVGCAVTYWHQNGAPGGAVVRCTVFPDGSVEVANGSQDIGTGHRTMMALVAAEELGLTANDIKVTIGDTTLGLDGPASGGSVTTPTVAPAVRSACYRAKMQLFDKVAEKWKVDKNDLETKNGEVFSKSNGSKRMTWKDAAALIRSGTLVAMGEHVEHPAIPENIKADDLNDFGSGAYGAQFAEVEVDTETGKVKVLRVVAVQDIGKTLAKMQTESQICGAVIQGISYALFEDRIMDNMTGRPMNPNMEDYKILTVADMPQIEPVIVDVFDPVNNASAKGLGEPPHIPTAAAVGCAVANALGVPVRDLPITPDKVLAALMTKEG